MEFFIVGQGRVRLGQADFVGQGGEASVYARGDLAFKVYTDPRKMLPPAKIQELSVLTDPRFSPETDWFSFAIISFQMFIGIHPYRGLHPSLPDLDARMSANVSVLNPRVSIPKLCYPFSVIPQAYRDWYRAIFEDGKRVPPP